MIQIIHVLVIHNNPKISIVWSAPARMCVLFADESNTDINFD